MASKVEIVNLALTRLGQRSVQSLDEASNEAVWGKKLYDRVRRTVLREVPWRFALKLETLALLDEDPPTYSYSYALPSDCLMVVDVVSSYQNTQAAFERVGNAIWTDEPSAQLRYISDVQDATKFDDAFIDAFAFRLAAEIAPPLTGKPELMSMMMQGYMTSRGAAQALSARESRKTNLQGSTIKDSRA